MSTCTHTLQYNQRLLGNGLGNDMNEASGHNITFLFLEMLCIGNWTLFNTCLLHSIHILYFAKWLNQYLASIIYNLATLSRVAHNMAK